MLTDIERASPERLVALRDDLRLAAAYAIAHPPLRPDQTDDRAGPRRTAWSSGWDANRREKTVNDAPRVLIVTALPRDAALLVGAQGYALRAAGIANMFPHTAHVESVALFER